MLLFSIVVLLVLLVLGLPVAFALALAGVLFLYFSLGSTILISIPQIFFTSMDSYTLLAIPFFLLASEFMLMGGISRPLINLAESFLGHIRGGLAMAAILASMIFGAITGSSAACIVAIGSITIPEMIKRGYSPRMTWGLAATTGGLGILIPPSIPMVIYGNITDQSIGKLFLAGVGPGILLTIVYIAFTFFQCRKNPNLEIKIYTWKQRLQALKEAAWALLMPVIILGGIYGGIFTPTEAAAVAAVYAFLVGTLVYKKIRGPEIITVLSNAAGMLSIILLIIAGATVFGYTLTLERIPQQVANLVTLWKLSPFEFILLGSVLIQIMGLFLETVSILTIIMPIFYPILIKLGIDPVFYGAIFVLNMELDLLTPPVGMNLFVTSSISNAPLREVVMGSLPYWLLIVAVLFITILFPPLALWLPSLVK